MLTMIEGAEGIAERMSAKARTGMRDENQEECQR